MERFFQITAVILAGIAAYFLWSGSGDAAFIAAVLGAVSFFLTIRFQVKARITEKEAELRRREDLEFTEPARLSDNFDSTEQFEDGQRTTDDEQKANL